MDKSWSLRCSDVRELCTVCLCRSRVSIRYDPFRRYRDTANNTLQYDLRESFAALFNRQEINDLLDRLVKEGRITRVVPKDIAVSDKYIDLMDVRYEPLISYLPEVLW